MTGLVQVVLSCLHKALSFGYEYGQRDLTGQLIRQMSKEEKADQWGR